METISGKGSLILWENNENNSKIACMNSQMFITQNYLDFFGLCYTEPFKGKFCKTWQSLIDMYEKSFKDFWKTKNPDKDALDKLFHKFRGNVAEILVEAFVYRDVFSYWDKNTYSVPENRKEEDYTDASALSSDDHILEGIQIKNWSKSVTLEVFQKACAQSALDFMNKEKFPNAELYRNKPRQHIISFSDGDSILHTHKEFQPVVNFIGPRNIDLVIRPKQANDSYGLKNIFKAILEEISQKTTTNLI